MWLEKIEYNFNINILFLNNSIWVNVYLLKEILMQYPLAKPIAIKDCAFFFSVVIIK